MSTLRGTFAAALAIVALALTGCATNAAQPGGDPTTPVTAAPSPSGDGELGIDSGFTPTDVTWFPDGRMFVLTGDDGGCGSSVGPVTANGQTVTVTMLNNGGPDTICVAMAYQGLTHAIWVPEGVDPTKPVDVHVTHLATGDATLDLAPLAEVQKAVDDHSPRGMWLTDTRIALVVWDSPTCVSEIVSATQTGENAATLAFGPPEPTDADCAVDHAPQLVTVSTDDWDLHLTSGATLTLTGLPDAPAAGSSVTLGATP